MRVFFLAALLFLSLGAAHCRGADSNKSDGPAGKVLALSGTASASSSQRGERKLAVGDVVYREDRIVTGGESSIEIRLDHNGALWSLRGARQVVVGESPAWRAKLASADLLDPTAAQKTGAAGRHGERQAGEDSSALLAVADVENEKAAIAPASEPVPPLENKDGAEGGPAASGPSDEHLPTKETSPKTASGKGGRSAPPKHDVDSTVTNSDIGQGAGEGSGAPDDMQVAWPVPKFEVSIELGPLSREVVIRVLRSRRPQMAKCAQTRGAEGKLEVELSVSNAGAIASDSIKVSGDAALQDQIGSCVRDVLSGLSMPSTNAATRVKLVIEFPAA